MLTAEEFAELPDPIDGSKQELVRGVVVTEPPTGARHGVCCSNIAMLLGNHLAATGQGIATCNNAGVITERNPDTVRGPDIAFWSAARASELPEGYFEIPPDLAVEVISPSDTHHRIQEKVRHYIKHGVKLVWLVDPELRIVTVYRSTNQSQTLEETDTLDGNDVLPGLSCRVADLFG